MVTFRYLPITYSIPGSGPLPIPPLIQVGLIISIKCSARLSPLETVVFPQKGSRALIPAWISTSPSVARCGAKVNNRWSPLIDVAGGSGGLSIALARACSSLRATVVDQPSVTPVTQRIVDETEVADRVSVVEADAVSGPLTGTCDVAALRSFIQVLSPEQAGRAIKNVGQVIEPGGRIYVIGAILDNSHITPAETAVLNLNLLNTFDHGQAYTEREYEDWLVEAGFGDCQRNVQANGVSIMTARKFG